MAVCGQSCCMFRFESRYRRRLNDSRDGLNNRAVEVTQLLPYYVIIRPFTDRRRIHGGHCPVRPSSDKRKTKDPQKNFLGLVVFLLLFRSTWIRPAISVTTLHRRDDSWILCIVCYHYVVVPHGRKRREHPILFPQFIHSFILSFFFSQDVIVFYSAWISNERNWCYLPFKIWCECEKRAHPFGLNRIVT